LSSWVENSPTKRYARLVQENSSLKKMNQELVNIKNIHYAKVRDVASKIAKRTVRNTAYNLSSIPSEAIPYLGIAVVLAVTASDIKDACSNMKDIDEMISTLGLKDGQNEKDKICGQNIPLRDAVVSRIELTKKEYSAVQANLSSVGCAERREAHR
jgi:hypothetical protein